MRTQPTSHQLLLLALRANQQSHQQTDAGTIHIVQAAEIEQDGFCAAVAGLRKSIHQDVFSKTSHVPLNINDADLLVRFADFGVEIVLSQV